MCNAATSYQALVVLELLLLCLLHSPNKVQMSTHCCGVAYVNQVLPDMSVKCAGVNALLGVHMSVHCCVVQVSMRCLPASLSPQQSPSTVTPLLGASCSTA